MIIRNSLGDGGNYEELTPSSATGITLAKLTNSEGKQAAGAFVSVQDAGINFNFDGSTPTNTASTDDGHPLSAGESIVLEGINNLKNFLCIDQSSASRVKISIYF